MSYATSNTPMILHPDEIEPVDRGMGVKTIPLVGKWNTVDCTVTTGITVFAPRTAIPQHTHNVEETVMVLKGEATAVIGDNHYELGAEDTTWVPGNVPHYFVNRGEDQLRIYWVYSGREITRTICSTGETVEHLSERDRGARPS